MRAVAVAGQVFQDTIDGYFPLQTALRHLMQRRGFGAAWIRLLHAPILHLPDLPPEAPVPLYLKTAEGGMLHHLSLVVVRRGEEIGLSGAGRWSWSSEGTPLTGLTRLGEPAFLRGIGLFAGETEVAIETTAFGPLTPVEESGIAYAEAGPIADALASLGWDRARLWPVPDRAGQITQTNAPTGRVVGRDSMDHTPQPGLLTRIAPNDPAARLARER